VLRGWPVLSGDWFGLSLSVCLQVCGSFLVKCGGLGTSSESLGLSICGGDTDWVLVTRGNTVLLFY
jgi:hypothetical protein